MASLLPKEDQNYIDSNGIQQIFVNAAVQLCSMRPDNPYSFLRQYFQVLESMQNPYQCVCCNEILEFAMFELHMHKCRSSPYRCNVCHQSFADNQALQNHRSVHAAATASASDVAVGRKWSSAHQAQLNAVATANSQSDLNSSAANNSLVNNVLAAHQQSFTPYQDILAAQQQLQQQSAMAAAHQMVAAAAAVQNQQSSAFTPQSYQMSTHQAYQGLLPVVVPPPNASQLSYHPHHHSHHHNHQSADEPYHQSHLSELMNFHTGGDIKPIIPTPLKAPHSQSSDLSEHNSQSETFTQRSDSSGPGGSALHASGQVAHHGNAKTFDCGTCSRSFLHKHRYLRHLATHTDERPYQCKVCAKAFSQAYYLSRHEKTHTDEKPHQCDICMKAFSQTYYLSRHMKTHSGERPFQCSICQKSFVLSYSLRKHMRTHASASGS